MKRLSLLAVAGVAFSLVLFYFMAMLIRPSGNFKRDNGQDYVISFTRTKNLSRTEVRDRKAPEKPPEQQEKLPQPKSVPKSTEAPKPDVQFDTPKLALSLSELSSGPSTGISVAAGGGQAAAGNADSAPVPLVRIEPQYPRQAAMRGQEGWVQLKFNITHTGEVQGVQVVSSQPPRIFDRAASNAVLKWKYRPQLKDGKPTLRENVLVQLDFKLRD